MSDKVYQAAGEDLCRRMRNWARWWDASENGGVLPSSLGSLSVELGCRVDRYREAELPLLFGEGDDTEAAMRELQPRYEQVIRKFWLNEGKGLRWLARQRLVDHHTIAAWLIEGHERLRGILSRRSEAMRQRGAAARAIGAGA